jgi:DNA-binding beta-propeller fold protein YncE
MVLRSAGDDEVGVDVAESTVRPVICLIAVMFLGCTSIVQAQTAAPEAKSIALPDAPAEGVFMDYLAYDHAHHRVWAPAGNTGNVDVVDVSNGHVDKVRGFATSKVERHGRKRTVGPSSAAVGEGIVYIGNRGDSGVCPVDARTLRRGACLLLDSTPDALAYVRSAKEVWATTPRDKSITIIDATLGGVLAVKTKMTLQGQPEGFAVDDARGIFYTNLEDKDATLAIDIKSRQVKRSWQPRCGENGPKGLALDLERNFLFVACSDRVKALDAGHDGKELSAIDTGRGVDNIDYLEARHDLYVAAARAGILTIVSVDSSGKLKSVAVLPTAPGARNAVVTDDGTAYVTDSAEGKLLVLPGVPPR